MKLTISIIARYGIAAVMSPASASGRVGTRLDSRSSRGQVRLPSRMSPKRCTRMWPAPSMLHMRPTMRAYSIGSWKGSRKLKVASTATLVLSDLRSL